jgi:hypothetical protein
MWELAAGAARAGTAAEMEDGFLSNVGLEILNEPILATPGSFQGM